SIGVWFFDSLVHYSWFSGRIAWAASCAATVLLVGVGSRIAAGRDPKWAILVVLVGLVAIVLHPIPALFGLVVLVGLALGRRGLLPWRRALLAGSALLPSFALASGSGGAALSS